jgi:hypothetical protein
MPPEVSGLLTRKQAEITAAAIAGVQLRSGCIPATEGGSADPWNHVEAAMALDVAGLTEEAERAYLWLAATQRRDGSWGMCYHGDQVIDPAADANFCAYIATGAWHHYLATGGDTFLVEIWPVVEAAVDFALTLQAPGGELLWAQDALGRPAAPALLTSNSCVHLSIGCAVEIASVLGLNRPGWESGRVRLANTIHHRPEAFADRSRFSMDWYYPVLGGVLEGPLAQARLAAAWDRFVVEGVGARCVEDRPWVTVAETCELVLALDAVGWTREAFELFGWIQELRGSSGAYWTGTTFPEGRLWPEEQPTWTSAAVLLAADALCDASATARLFKALTAAAA